MAPVSMILSDLETRFPGHDIIQHHITCKRYKLELRWRTNRKSYMVRRRSNCSIFNDLERPQTQISRSGHSLTLNISEMVKDTAIVTIEGE